MLGLGLRFGTRPKTTITDPAPKLHPVRIVAIGQGAIEIAEQIIPSESIMDRLYLETDIRPLERILNAWTFCLGKRVARGLGSQGLGEVAYAAFEESRDELNNIIDTMDAKFGAPKTVILIVCLGGGMGHIAPNVAELFKSHGANVVAFATMPFKFEGEERAKSAAIALKNLQSRIFAVFARTNDQLDGGVKNLTDATYYSNQTISGNVELCADAFANSKDGERDRDICNALIRGHINEGAIQGLKVPWGTIHW